ncbi:MAG: response regulator [Alphaproteobacteria bacterium]|nr:response regulator [Alphaproteobacteria bacterium]
MRIVVVEELELLGFAVTEADSVRAALAAVDAAKGLGAAIIDVGLPDGRGDDLAAKVRQRLPRLPIVMVSGYDDHVLRGRFAGDGAMAFLRKPYLTEDLARLLAAFGLKGGEAGVGAQA